MRTIRLWDLPVRVFHWLLVIAVFGAIATVKLGGTWMVWHERFGLSVLGLLSFRLVWGFTGSTYARFSQFVRGPSAVIAYLKGDWQGLGHNPLGALSVLLLMAMFAFQALTGLFATDEIAFNGPLYRAVSTDWNDTFTHWHHLSEWFLYGVIALHVLAIMFYIHVKKTNLVKPMITGYKEVPGGVEAKDATGGGVIGFLLAVAIAAAVVWVATGGLLAPPPAPPQDLGW